MNSSPELLTKKGWLMKQGLTKEWHKYWFVLQDVALLYYRDPTAENKGFLDGIIDLSLVQRVDKVELPRHFGFSILTFEAKTIVFSAITDGIRNNWITSLRKAANLSDNPKASDPDDQQSLVSSSTSTSSTSIHKPLTKRSSSFSDVPMTITTTKIVRSSTSSVLIPPKVPAAAMNIPKVTTTPSSSNEQDDEEDSSEYDDDDDEEEEEDQDEVLDNAGAEGETGGATSSSGEGVLVDLLETEVDSLKSKLELTQSELYNLHNSNMNLTSQLRQSKQQQQQQAQTTASTAVTKTGKKYSSPSAASSQPSSLTSTGSASGIAASTATSDRKSSSSVYERNTLIADELTKVKADFAKQSADLLSLKNQLSMSQVSFWTIRIL